MEDVIGVYDITLWDADHRAVSTADSSVAVKIRCSQPDAKAYAFSFGTPTDVDAVYENGWLTFTIDRCTKVCITAAAGVELPVCGDGVVTAVEATMVQRYDANLIADMNEASLNSADIDGSGKPDIVDSVLIQRYLVNIEVDYPIGRLF